LTEADCFICRKHRGEFDVPGGAIVEDDLLFASHLWATPEGVPDDVYLGHVKIETKRHAPYLSDLTDEEAEAVGRVASRLSRAMKAVLGADYVFAAVIGLGVAHFHFHLLARYPGTPADLEWDHVDEWEGAPRGGFDEVAALTERLRASLH
jgi:histidine triad (HIT) family protein